MKGFYNRVIKNELPFAFGSPTFIWQALFFYLPMLLMLISSFMQFSEEGFFQRLTLDHFIPLFKPTYLKVIASSLLLALTTAGICILLAFPLAHFIAFKGGNNRKSGAIKLVPGGRFTSPIRVPAGLVGE